ncbi:hypothetical protein Hanom_Chr12g01104121 [Helianthus anomalus]
MMQEVEPGCRYLIEDPSCESALDCLERSLKKNIHTWRFQFELQREVAAVRF